MKLMKSKDGAYMYVYTPAEEKRAKDRGWKEVKEPKVTRKSKK